MKKDRPLEKYRAALNEIIFEAETPASKIFDIILIVSIVLSVTIVMLDSVSTIRNAYGNLLVLSEWFFTFLFTIEYCFRLFCAGRPFKYAISFLGIIDFLAIIPTYLSLVLPGSQFFIVIRILRVLRIFRVFKLVQYLVEIKGLNRALRASRRKIIVFLLTVFTLVIIFGSIMYVIEGEQNGFTSIPQSIYWAIVTLTTVGYGDISPKTNLGQALAAVIMIIGYAIIAVPTGIVTTEMVRATERKVSDHMCRVCNTKGHDIDAKHCKYCGAKL